VSLDINQHGVNKIEANFFIVYPRVMTAMTVTDKTKRAGRRAKNPGDGQAASVTHDAIIAHALQIAQHEPVDAITIMRLSRELGVTPALIHYFTGGRDQLLSAVINRAMAQSESHPAVSDSWLADLEAVMRKAFAFQMKWKGITTYQQSNNKYRLFQDPQPGEADLGLVFFNRVGTILQSSGMTAEHAAMAYHLLMLFILSVAVSHINKQEPAAHEEFLNARLGQLDSKAHPGAAFLLGAFASVSTADTFEVGLQALLATIVSWAPPT